jgi:putative membrane protein
MWRVAPGAVSAGTAPATGPGTPMLFAEHVSWNLDMLGNSLLAAAAFGLLGIAMLALGFKVFEWITPKLHIEEELGKGNTAVGIVVAAAIVGVALIVVRAIGG